MSDRQEQQLTLWEYISPKYKLKQPVILLDPFAGSSTTLLAAKHLKRRYIGFEIDKEYFDTSVKRLSGENIKGELNLFDIDYD